MKKETFDKAANPSYRMDEPIPGHEDEMKENYAGGVGFDDGALGLVRRFVILGIDNGTYYRTEHELSGEVMNAIAEAAKNAPEKLMGIIIAGRVSAMRPRNPIAAYAIALAHMDHEARAKAHAEFPKVIHTGSDLLYFMSYTKILGRGVGRGLRRAISRWYASFPNDDLEFQLVKYRNRQGFHQRDVIRLAHPRPKNEFASQLFANMLGKDVDPTPRLEAIERIKHAEAVGNVLEIVEEAGLTWEMVPTDPWHKKSEFWAMMVDKLPWHAFLRHLHRYIAMGQGAPGRRGALKRLRSMNKRRLNVHPGRVFDAYLALRDRGALDHDFADALKGAFFRGFDVAGAGADYNIGIAIDTSGSMFPRPISEALATAEVVRRSFFSSDVVFFHSSAYVPKPTIAMGELAFMELFYDMHGLQSGGTNVAASVDYFIRRNSKLDGIVIITDEQSWGGEQVVSAFNRYRRKVKRDAKLIVVSLAPGDVSLTDPRDPNQVTVVGWVPEIAVSCICLHLRV